MGSFQFALALLLALLGLPLTKFNRGIEEVAFQFIHFILVQYCPLTNLCQPRAAVEQIWRVTHFIPSLSSFGQLAEATQGWNEMGHSPDLLYRGARLAQVREWAILHQDEMNELECDFLNASIELSEREAQEREEQRQRELEATHRLAESERQRAEEQVRSVKRLRQRSEER